MIGQDLVTLLSGVPYYERTCRGLGEAVEGLWLGEVQDTGCLGKPSLLPHFTWEEAQAGQGQTRGPVSTS